MGLTENQKYLTALLKKSLASTEHDEDSWSERQAQENHLKSILKESPTSILLVAGPSGSGKNILIKRALRDVKYKMFINLDELVSADEHIMLSRLASQVNFYPYFGSVVQFGAIIDAIVFSLTATKAGFGVTADSEVRKILESVVLATTTINLDEVRERVAWVKGHPEIPESQVPLMDVPVIVIQGFLSKSGGKNQFLYDMLTNWASELVNNRLAQVVFVSENPGSVKMLDKANASKSLEAILLDDAPFESAMNYVRARLGDKIAGDMKKSVEGLGGRITELQLLIQKIKAGSGHIEAYEEIVNKAMTEVRKIGNETNSKWTQPQFWKVCQLLAKSDEVCYDDLRFSPVFNGDEVSLSAMEGAGVISIISSNGRPISIKASRPVFRRAFKSMIDDVKYAATMNLLSYKALQASEQVKITGYETELRTLTEIITGNGSDRNFLVRSSRNSLEERVFFLTSVLSESNKKFTEAEEGIRKCKKQLALKGS